MAITGQFAHLSGLFSYSVVAFSAIFFVVDPFAVVPVFITITEGDSEEKRREMARRACMVSAAILLAFLVGGGLIFKLFSLTLAAFKIAGGILLLLTALDMLRSMPARTRTSGKELSEAVNKPDVAIVPLAMPLLAGPGAIATVMVLVGKAPNATGRASVYVAIFMVSLIAFGVLRSASLMARVLGQTGINLISRFMGLILAAIAVQFVLDGVLEAFPRLGA